ncbi:hypothetical protein Hanom_Chr16g01422731 [Helianthus anomalus]
MRCSNWFWSGVGISLFCGLWVEHGDVDGLGTAVIRGFYNTRVVIWPYGLPLLSMFFVISLRWDWGVCVSVNSVVLFEQWINSAFKVWVLGNRRLGISLCPGNKRKHQVFVSRKFLSPSIFIYRTVQRLGNHCVGKKPVCVVCSGSTWTRSVGFLGMGSLWVSGEIRVLKAWRVVIFLYSWPDSSGVLTILVTSAIMVRGYRFVVLWGCTNLGVIRMEAVAAGRSLNSFSSFFCPFVVHSSDTQTWVVWLIWFLSKPFIVFTLNLLSLYSILGGVFWGFECESGDIRGLSSAWVVILLNPLRFRSVCFFHSHLCFCFIGDLSLFCFFVASLKGALTILATSTDLIGGVGFFVLWGCNSPGVIRRQITTLGMGLFDDFGVGWFSMLGSKEEVLKYARDEDYVIVDIGWVRRYVKEWVRRLLLSVDAAGYKSCCSFRRGGLVVGQFGPMGWAQMQGKFCLFVLKSGMEIIWKWGMFFRGVWYWDIWHIGLGGNFDLKICWKGRKAGIWVMVAERCQRKRMLFGRIMEWELYRLEFGSFV